MDKRTKEYKEAQEQSRNRETREEPKRTRKERQPLGVQRQKLDFEQKPGKVRRIINTNWHKDPNRFQNALDGGYTVVMKEDVGDTSHLADLPEELGSAVTRIVGTNKDGSKIIGVLMEIDEELYNEDQAMKDEPLQEIDNQIQRGQFGMSSNDARYVPKGGIKMTQGSGS